MKEQTKYRSLLSQEHFSDRPLDAEAGIIVGIGYGCGKEGLVLGKELARLLRVPVGASRAAVSAGYLPFAQQIGISNRHVRPHVYVALGISGAVQHMAGLRGTEVILAINKDPDAPVHKNAACSIIGDVRIVLPALIAELKSSGFED